jgi:hypothetical protein
MPRFLLPLCAALALLSACGKPDNALGPGGVTVGEAKALDEAAEMIEQRRVPVVPAPAAQPAPSPTAEPSG